MGKGRMGVLDVLHDLQICFFFYPCCGDEGVTTACLFWGGGTWRNRDWKCSVHKNLAFSYTSASLTMLKLLIVWITTNCGKFFKRGKYQTSLPASWETCMQVKKQLLEPDTEQQTGSKLGKEYVKAVYCHPVYLTYMQSTSCEMLGWMNHSWKQDWGKKYQ